MTTRKRNTRKPAVKADEIRLVKDDKTKIVRSREDLVAAKFDGWQVDKAGAESVAENPAGDNPGPTE